MSYEVYKFLHVILLFTFVSGLTTSFLLENNPKIMKILTGVSSFLIFVAGMGLIARLNISHGEPWPVWIKVKIGLWLSVSVLGPVLSKRLTSHRGLGLSGCLALTFAAVYVAVFKPF